MAQVLIPEGLHRKSVVIDEPASVTTNYVIKILNSLTQHNET